MVRHQLPEPSPAHIAFTQRVREAEDRTARYVIPVFATNERLHHYALGSAVLLKISNKHFLISAAHVFDEHRNPRLPTDLLIPGRDRLIALSGTMITSSLPPSGRRNDDKVDIGILHLDHEVVHELAHFRFLGIKKVDPSDAPYPQSLYTFVGYPGTKQKPPQLDGLTIEPVRYTSRPLPPTEYPEGFALGTHYAIDYDKESMIARNGKVQAPPSPRGISGGGIFRLGTFDEIANGTNTEALVGIAIEDHRYCLVATNISFALEMIRAHHPQLAKHLPRSRQLTISISAPR